MKITLSVLLLLFTAQLSFAQAEVETPAPGSPQRVALMDALRGAVEPELEQKVVFKIDHLKVKNGWAFMRGVPQKPNGEPVNYKKTKYQEAIKEGMFDDGICALFRRDKGEWTVVEFVIGATDVPWVGWDSKHSAPKAIFK